MIPCVFKNEFLKQMIAYLSLFSVLLSSHAPSILFADHSITIDEEPDTSILVDEESE